MKKHPCFVIVFLMLSCFYNCSGQNLPPGEQSQLDIYLRSNGRFQYISGAPLFENLSGDRQLFEAQVGPGFNIVKNQDKRLALRFETMLTLRMYDFYSKPVRPLNFMPYFRWVHFIGKKPLALYYEFTAGHLSNGQDDAFYEPDSMKVNFKSGDFSTNFLSLKVGKVFKFKEEQPFQWSKIAVGYQFNGGIDKTILAFDSIFVKSYGQHRIMLDFNLASDYIPIRFSFKKKAPEDRDAPICFRIHLRTENVWILGDLSNYQNTFNDELYRFSNKTRLIFDFYPWKAFNPFIQFYYGRDYYNMRYVERLISLSLGLYFDLN